MVVTKLGAKLDAALILCLCALVAAWAGSDGSTAGWINVGVAVLIAILTVLTLVERLRQFRVGEPRS